VLHSPTRPALGRPTARRVSLLALLILVAVPAAAEARNYKVDGRVKGAPAANRGSVTVPFRLTAQVGRKLRLGTRNVRVRISRRAWLPLSGSGARGASRIRATGLRAGDRVRGVTWLTRKLRRRLRSASRPTLRLKRARVIRSARRLAPPAPGAPGGPGGPGAPAAPGAPGAPAAPRTLEQVLNELSGRVMSLTAKVGEFGTLAQQIEAQKLQLDSLSTGLDGVTTAFDALTSALEGRPDAELIELTLLPQVEGLVVRVEALGNSTSAVETALGSMQSGIDKIGSALQELATMAPLLAGQASLIRQFPGAESQVLALDEALRRIEGRVGAVEAALGTIASSVNGLNAAMASLANSVNAVAATAATAPLGAVQEGVNGLAGGVANLEAAFGALASLNGAAPDLATLEADAIALEGMVDALCTSIPTACP
jgi:outer membrane murein-binding lipoprotein Lpp